MVFFIVGLSVCCGRRSFAALTYHEDDSLEQKRLPAGCPKLHVYCPVIFQNPLVNGWLAESRPGLRKK